MNQSKHYTAEEIERYHSGQLSPAEMHALEKAALDDPFLADALEGFYHTATPSADLSQLEQKLQLRIEKDNKRRGLFFMNSSWMRVAALVILCAGGGWLVFQTFSGNNRSNTDVATNQGAKPQAPSVTESLADSTSEVVSDAPASTAPTVPLQERNDPGNASRNDVALTKPAAGQIESAPVTLSLPKKEQLEEQNTLQEMTALRQNVYVDTLSLRGATAAKEKDNAKAGAVDTIRNLNVIMKPTQLPADEVVVLSNRAAAPQAKRRMYVVVDTLEPAEGWTNFDDYIASNLKTPEEFKSKPVKGEVELMFDVNRAGEPVNITVVKSLCEKCDEEAIRLLKEGPKWKQNKKKGKIKIRF